MSALRLRLPAGVRRGQRLFQEGGSPKSAEQLSARTEGRREGRGNSTRTGVYWIGAIEVITL